MRVTILFLFLCFTIIFVLANCKRAKKKDKATTVKCHLRKEYWNDEAEPNLVAVALLRGQGNFARTGLKGKVKFEQQYYGGPVRVSAEFKNLQKRTKHGFFILEYGRGRCNREGNGHFNPTNSPHGKAKSCYRHHGDLEPIKSDENGQIIDHIQWDPRLKLQGPYSIIGRTASIILRSDDENEDSYRIACGIVGYANNTNFTSNTFRIPSVDDEEFPVGILAFVALLMMIVFAKTIYEQYWIKPRAQYQFDDKNIELLHKRRVAQSRKLQNCYLWRDDTCKSKLLERQKQVEEILRNPKIFGSKNPSLKID